MIRIIALFALLAVGMAPLFAYAAGEPADAQGHTPLIVIGDPDEDGQHIASPAEQEHATLDGHSDTDADNHADHAGHGEVDGLPQFDPSSFPSQIFWLAVVFILLYIFFSRKTLPDISKVIDTRQGHIQGDLDNAESLKVEAEKVKAAYEEILEEARHKSTEAFAAVEAAIAARSEENTKEFLKRTSAEIENTEKKVAEAKAAALGEIDVVAAKVAAQAAERIIGVKVDTKYAQQVVDSLNGQKKAA